MDRVEYEKMIVQELVNFHSSGELNINPWYQRRSVWTRPQKAYLINSLLEQKPIPSLYIRHSLDVEAEKSIREVVDGQQRVRAILEYVENKFAARHPNHSLKVKYNQLSKSERSKLKLTSLSVGYLLGANDGDVIEIFGRLNSVAKTLNAQEKRNALFSGDFKQFCLREAATRIQLWRDLKVFSANDIARMQEVQFIADLTINMLHGLSDFNQANINKIYDDNEESFSRETSISKRMERLFGKVASIDPPAIRDTIFSRQPLFFTLCVVIDSYKTKMPIIRLERALCRVDENFNSDIPISRRSIADADFYTACTASTQRIKSRRIRNKYLRRALRI